MKRPSGDPGAHLGHRGAGLREGGGLGKLRVGAGPPDLLAGMLTASAPQFPRTCSKVVQNMVEQLHET